MSIHSISISPSTHLVTISTSTSFSVFHPQTFELLYHVDFSPIQHAQLVPDSSLLIVLSGQLLHLYSLVEKRSIASISLPSIPQSFASNSRRLLVALPEKLLTFALPSLQLLDDLATPTSITYIACSHIKPDNPSPTRVTNEGLTALGLSNGSVLLYNTLTLERGQSIAAHTCAVSCMAFSPCGDFLSTASTKGTVVKTFQHVATPEPKWIPLTVFRRGTHAASIRYLSWHGSKGAFMLACSGDSDTIHVFQGSTSTGPSMTDLMPKLAKNFWEAQRAFTVVRLRCTGHENALILEEGALTVVSSAGFAFLYDVRPGECNLKKEFSLRSGNRD